VAQVEGFYFLICILFDSSCHSNSISSNEFGVMVMLERDSGHIMYSV